jgi:hypothetical protein
MRIEDLKIIPRASRFPPGPCLRSRKASDIDHYHVDLATYPEQASLNRSNYSFPGRHPEAGVFDVSFVPINLIGERVSPIA